MCVLPDDAKRQKRCTSKYKERQREHNDKHPDAVFEFSVINIGIPGDDLKIKEQQGINALGGVSNKKNDFKGGSQISEIRTPKQKKKMTAIKKKRIKVNEGDIFTIPLDNQTQGHGQIVKILSKYDFIIVVFEGRWGCEQEVQLDELVTQDILFIGYTTDTLLKLGRWVIIGNITSNLSQITLPYYKLAFPPETKLLNYKLDFIRMATPDEDKLLDFNYSMSPMGYQMELHAYYKTVEWKADIKYQYKHIINTLAKLNLLPN